MPEVEIYDSATDGTVISRALADDIRESVALGSAFGVSGQPSMLSSLAYADLIADDNLSQQNAASNQQAMNRLGLAVAGRANELLTDLSSLQSNALAKLATGNQIAEELADIKARLGRFRKPKAANNVAAAAPAAVRRSPAQPGGRPRAVGRARRV